jgi:hypothetical protein
MGTGLERVREIEYPGCDMFCAGDHEYEYCASSELAGFDI